MKDKKKYEYIPLVLLGCTFTLKGDMIIFNRMGNIEQLVLLNDGWHFRTGKIDQLIDHTEMDVILLGWFTQFDTIRGAVTLKIRTYCDCDHEYSWVRYKN